MRLNGSRIGMPLSVRTELEYAQKVAFAFHTSTACTQSGNNTWSKKGGATAVRG